LLLRLKVYKFHLNWLIMKTIIGIFQHEMQKALQQLTISHSNFQPISPSSQSS
jgi:hypothetical protein